MKGHRFDPVSFIWGVFFTALGVVFAADVVVEPTVAGLRSFWPLAGVALGLAILSTIRRDPREAGPAAPAPAPRAVQSPSSPFSTDEGASAPDDDEPGSDDDNRPPA